MSYILPDDLDLSQDAHQYAVHKMMLDIFSRRYGIKFVLILNGENEMAISNNADTVNELAAILDEARSGLGDEETEWRAPNTHPTGTH